MSILKDDPNGAIYYIFRLDPNPCLGSRELRGCQPFSVTVHGYWPRQYASAPPGSSRRTQRLAVGYRQIPLSARVEQGQNKVPDLLHTGSSQSVVTTPAANLVHRRDKPAGVPRERLPFSFVFKTTICLAAAFSWGVLGDSFGVRRPACPA